MTQETNQDIYEAARVLASNPAMASAGVDEVFAAMLAKNITHMDKLGPGGRDQIKEQFAAMAFDLQTLEKVARKTSDDKNRALAQWLTGVNLLLVMAKVSQPITTKDAPCPATV